MNRLFTLLGLASALLLFFAETASAAVCTPTQTFTPNSPNSGYSASFSVCDDSVLSMTITANTTGWVAVGFSPDQLMPNTDMVTGGVNTDLTLYGADRFAPGKQTPSADTQQDVTFTSGTETGGVTTLSFTRPLNTGDSVGDFNLLSGSYYLLWAYGASDTFSYHAGRGASASAYNFAPVPVPAAAWLFLSGLLGLLRLKCPAI